MRSVRIGYDINGSIGLTIVTAGLQSDRLGLGQLHDIHTKKPGLSRVLRVSSERKTVSFPFACAERE